jgi:hypothetical protein
VSISVTVDRIRDELARFGPNPTVFLLSVTGRQTPHAVSVATEWDGDRLVMRVGKGTASNAGERTSVTLLWPPSEVGDFSLIVDGNASVDGDRVIVTPESAVLHRAATTASGAYRNDCVRVGEPEPA